MLVREIFDFLFADFFPANTVSDYFDSNHVTLIAFFCFSSLMSVLGSFSLPFFGEITFWGTGAGVDFFT